MVLSQYEKAVFCHPHYKSLYNQGEFKNRKKVKNGKEIKLKKKTLYKLSRIVI